MENSGDETLPTASQEMAIFVTAYNLCSLSDSCQSCVT